MNELWSFGLLCFTSFFSLINPLSIMSIFITMTANIDDSNRMKIARKASIASFCTIILFAFSGQLLFRFFGISVDSFRVAGGVIFFLMGMDMLQARLVALKATPKEIKSYVNDVSITPLAIPMICGPGAITNGIILMEDASSVFMKAILVVAVFLVILLTYIILIGSTRITRVLGEVGNNVLMRIMGLIVMVMAVEFLFAGLRPYLESIVASGR